jgi:hypothetical protein
VSAAMREHSLESGAVHNSHKIIKPKSGILHGTVASERRGVRRPNCRHGKSWPLCPWRDGSLSRIWSGSGRFRDVFGVTYRIIAAPEHHVLTPTLFVAFFERLGGYRSRQLSLLAESRLAERFEPALGIER